MPADLASAAAAVTAGYTKSQYDRGASANPRYETQFEKHQVGIPGYSGGPVRFNGQSNVSAAAADTAALAALTAGVRIATGLTPTSTKATRPSS
jgi:hypothetical protein